MANLSSHDLLAMGVIVIFGGIFSIYGIRSVLRFRRKKKECTECTNGIVAEIIKEKTWHTSNSGNRIHTIQEIPVFEFCVNGTPIKEKSSCYSSSNHFIVGQKVTVFYNPNNIQDYYVVEENRGRINLIFLVISLLFLVGATTTYYFFKK